MTPEKYQNIVATITDAVQIDTQCHAHNDFGLAVSNTLAGLKGGARYFHVTVNGIGERAGMPDLAQVAVSLKVQYDIDLGLDLTKLTAVSELVAQATHSRLHPWQPIVGQNVFAHESGIHAKGSLNNGHAFEPFSPELLGRERSIVVGKHSGRASLKHALDALGIHHEEHELTELLYWVREVSMIKKQALTYKDVALLHAGVSRRGDSCRI
ncbi:2-isopropylmalate synthase [compost metagenome]